MNPASHLGTSPLRTDAPAKVRGTLRYTDDLIRPARDLALATMRSVMRYDPVLRRP